MIQTVPILGDRYRLLEPLGAGGMSVVWRAYDEVLGRRVAVKLLSAAFASDRHFRERVRAEAQSAAALVHPNVTAVYDYGVSAGPDGAPAPFVVMELLDGRTLSTRLAGGPLPWREAVEICAEVAAALSAAHARGLVHRDITPANVMLTATGVKVVDFGVSTVVGESGRDGPGDAVVGTPAYLAPERLAREPVGPAADVYALGVVLRLPWPDACRGAPRPRRRSGRRTGGCHPSRWRRYRGAAGCGGPMWTVSGERIRPGVRPPPRWPGGWPTRPGCGSLWSTTAQRLPGRSPNGSRQTALGSCRHPASRTSRPRCTSRRAGSVSTG
jgi:serine/threonine protein kinase